MIPSFFIRNWQGAAVESEPRCRATRPGQHPAGLLQRRQNVQPLGFLERPLGFAAAGNLRVLVEIL
jgi:hypothetical protein